MHLYPHSGGHENATNPVKCALLLAVSIRSHAIAHAQTDSNPWNPANWESSLTSLTSTAERVSFVNDATHGIIPATPTTIA